MVKGSRAAGSFLGGIFNNPGIVILGALGIALVFFAGDIRKAFAGFGESFGKIELPDITLPPINFPAITFPDFNIDFPDFPDFGAGFAAFGDQITQALDDISKSFVPEERIDVPLNGQTVDVVPDVTGGRADRFEGLPDQPNVTVTETPTDTGTQFDVSIGTIPDVTGGRAERLAGVIERELSFFEKRALDIAAGIPFAVANVEESQEQFQERSAIAALTFPDIFENTSFGSVPSTDLERQLSRNSDDFAAVLAEQAQQSESIFTALFGNLQNPNF